jgi:hypothetical protein
MATETRPGLVISAQAERYLRDQFGAGNGQSEIIDGNNAAIVVSMSSIVDTTHSRRSLLKAAIGGALTGVGLVGLRSDTPKSRHTFEKRSQPVSIPREPFPLVPETFLQKNIPQKV